MHVIAAAQLERPWMEALFERAATVADLQQTRSGRAALAQRCAHLRVLNLFAQPSSRTFFSFEAAEMLVGLERMSLRDLATSSAAKGESLEDTFRTFFAYCDLLVMRHHDADAIELAAEVAEDYGVVVVNAGSGTREHPTQALLDLYTIQQRLGAIDGKRIVLVGDLKRGRTVRSLARLFCQYDVELVLAAPERLQLEADVLDRLTAAGVPWRQTDQLEVDADVVYLTRVQDEWDEGHDGGHPPTDPRFVFGMPHLERLPGHAIVMHPLPKRDEVTAAVCDTRDPRLAWWEQVKNGLFVRAALLETLLN